MATLDLLHAYMRRKRWEARLLAVQVVNAFGESMNGGKKAPVSLEALSVMGFRIEGTDG